MRFWRWLTEAILDDYLAETIISFGKFKGQDHTQLNTSYLQWLLDAMDQPGNSLGRYIGPAFRKEIEQTIMARSSNKPAAQSRPQVPTPQPAATPKPTTAVPQKPTAAKKWYYAKAKITSGNLVKGRELAMAEYDGTDDEYYNKGEMWEFRMLDPQFGNQVGYLPHEGIANYVQSFRYPDSKPITTFNPSLEDLHQKLDSGNSQTPDLTTTEEPADTSAETPEVKSKFQPSAYQQQIQHTFQNSNSHIVIEALAGSGKTTVLTQLSKLKQDRERAKGKKERWLYLVFGKRNQVDSKSKFPPDVEIRTSHSFLGNVLKDNLGSQIDDQGGILPNTEISRGGQKVGEIIEQNRGEWFKERANQLRVPYNRLWPFKSRVKKLTNLAKNFAFDPRSNQIGVNLDWLIQKYAIDTSLTDGKTDDDFSMQIVEMAAEVLELCLPNAHPQLGHVRDHDDTVWWTSVFADQIRWPKYDVVLADEVQDFNRCQLSMLNKLQGAGARVIAVGDRNQAIYAFRGADSEAFDKLHSMLGDTQHGSKVHDLPVNYRSAEQIINFVNEKTHVKNLQAGAKDPKTGGLLQGQVTEHQLYNDVMENLSQEWMKTGKLAEETAMICRTNKPLVHAALNLLKTNMPFVIIGRDFVNDLVEFIRKVIGPQRRGSATPEIMSFWQKLQQYRAAKEAEFGNRSDKDAELLEIQETTDALEGVLDYLESNSWIDPQTGKQPIRTSQDFIDYLKRVFSGLNVEEDEQDNAKYEQMQRDPTKYVTLATAHRSKGLEFDRTFVLRNDLFPHPASKTPDELAQEANLQYVGYTRARKQLHVLNDTEPGGKKKH